MLFLPLPCGVRRAAPAAVVALLIASDGRGPMISASWDGPDAGKLKVAAAVSWCPGARRLEIEAIKGDAGVALVIYPVKALRPGRYEAFDPGLYPMQRPGSAAALRWFSEQEVQGYQSDSGSAQGTEVEGGYQVRFGYRMIAAVRSSRQVKPRLRDRCRLIPTAGCCRIAIPDTPAPCLP